jgi:predicted PurR-regulated permease PerM
VQQFDGHILTPMVFSHTTRLHPITVIVAIVIGFTFLGLVGAFLAVPVAALLVRYYREDYLDSQWYRGKADDGAA